MEVQVTMDIKLALELQNIVESDTEALLTKLPPKMNNDIKRQLRSRKWFNINESMMLEASETVRDGRTIKMFTNPVGLAYDLSGDWKEANLKTYVSLLKSEGYYRRYMRKYRSGEIQKGKIRGKKRIPYLTWVISKMTQYSRSILNGQP